MLIALTGLHGSGKSYFAKNIPPKFGFIVYNKNDLLEQIYNIEYGSGNWKEWYCKEFNKSIYNITKKMLSYLSIEKNIILDAVHNNIEWQAINRIVRNSILAVVTTPEDIRKSRRELEDARKDIKRIEYWHSKIDNQQSCLLAEASWSFNGASSLITNEQSFKELVGLLHVAEKNRKNENKNLSEKDKEILKLMHIDREINRELEQTKRLLSQYNHKNQSVKKECEDYER